MCPDNLFVTRQIFHTPIGELQRLSIEELERLRRQLLAEGRYVHLALRWLDGAIRLKQRSMSSVPLEDSP